MAALRSALHLLWMLLTVIPWGLTLVIVSLWVRRTPLWWFAVGWFRVVMWGARVLLGLRVHVSGQEHFEQVRGSAGILLCKHQSALETLLIPTLVPVPLAFVFKRELLRIPFFGWSMARLDMIHIDRSTRAQAMKQVLSQGQHLLQQGTWIIIFPEGTRIPRGQEGTYQTAGTRLAVEAGVPVIPVAVASARFWPHDSHIKHAGVVEVSFGAPIASVGREPKELMREVQGWIESEMRRIDPQAYT